MNKRTHRARALAYDTPMESLIPLHAFTSTDLAHALAVPLDTPGCWRKHRCRYCDAAGAVQGSYVSCPKCKGSGKYHICLWPLPDSGKPGAELFMAALVRALGWPSVGNFDKTDDGLIVYECYACTADMCTWYGKGASEVAALYAAWQEREKA